MTESDEYPRVLIISPDVLNRLHGGGATMSHLFANWPKGRLAEIYRDASVAPNLELCDRLYRLYPRVTRRPAEWARRLVNYARGTSESLDGISSVRLTPRLRRWIDEFAPEVVFSQMGGLWLTRLTNKVAAYTRVPLVLHVSDDWIVDWPVNGLRHRNIVPLATALNLWCRRTFRQALDRASLRFCISSAMCREYERRYGYAFSTVHNGVDPDLWTARALRPRSEAAPFRVLYSGSILENSNLASLRDLADAVAATAESGVRIQMDIATHVHATQLRNPVERRPFVRVVDLVPYEDLPRRLAEVDLLVIPLNFDASTRWLRYSLLGKAAEYMLSGTPILVYGPANTATVQYAARDGWAHVVDRRDPRRLRRALDRLASDEALRAGLVARASEVGRRDHDIRRIRSEFQSALRRVAVQCTAAPVAALHRVATARG